ncbi:MAG TPA: type II toxin-antitoxin system VapB family antitoxin [Ramlibacter sp.]
MLTNIDIDEDLIADAMKVTGAKTKREVVDRALREVVARANRTRLRDVFGIGGIWEDYDPKGSPGEPPGKYRVEQPLASYKAQPGAVRRRAKK